MKEIFKLASVPGLVFALVCTGGTFASAQDTAEDEVPRGETVLSRPRPELDPLGIRTGSFLLFPKLTVEESYNDNIFNVESSKVDDFITLAKPELSLVSDWNNHALNLRADASFVLHADTPSEDFEDYHVGGDGRFDITRDSNIVATVDSSILHEDRGSPDDVGGIEPTEFMLTSGSLSFFQKFNRLNFTVDGSQLYYDYDDVATTAAPVNNDDRDRVESNVSLRVGYEIVPEYEAFAVLSGNVKAYDDAVDDSGLDRDAHGVRLDVGANFDLGGIVFGDVFVGYRFQDYEDSSLRSIDGLNFGTGIVWNVTPLTTLNGNITRVLEETTTAGASGFVATSVSVSADHELLRNLLLNANLGVTQNNFKGIDQEDLIYRGGIGAKYMLNRYLYASMNYDYTQKESDVGGGGVAADYKSNVVTLRLELQL